MVWINMVDLVAYNPPTQKEIDQVLDYRRRKAKARFYADENFPAPAIEVLRQTGARVATVQQVGRRRHPDENHAAYALKHGYVLLTCDRDYLDDRRFPLIHCPTIVVFNFGNGSVEEIRQAFTCLKRILSAPQFFDKWTKIDASRDSWIEYSRTLDGQTHRCKYRVFNGNCQEWVEDKGR
jgi:predicted nuclease of predicted toxin-antitoxin system